MRTSGPAIEPISLAEAKSHARFEDSDDDANITRYIEAARTLCEDITQRTFITTTWRQRFDYDDWPAGRGHLDGAIELPRPKLISITSITYVDTAGASQTVSSSDYVTETDPVFGYVYPAWDVTWPQVRSQRQAATITFTAGYGATAASVPAAARQAIAMLVSHWAENRGDADSKTIPSDLLVSVEALLATITAPRIP